MSIWMIFLALGLTLAFELTVAAVWWRKWNAIIPVLLVNVLTNPPLNVIMSQIMLSRGGRDALYWCVLAAAEVSVVLIEGFLLSRMLCVGHKKALLFALVANAVSYFSGVLLDVVGII